MKRAVVVFAALVSSCGTPPQRCTTASCRGCCFNDVCLDGTSDSACGRGGQECFMCQSALTCIAGACVSVSAGGGTGTAGGGAAGGSGTAGGATAGGTGTAGGVGTAGGTGTAGGGTGGGATAGGATAGGATAGGATAGGSAPGLCDESYRVAASPPQQSCLGVGVPWPTPVARLTQHADGGLTMFVDAGSFGAFTLRGSWDGGGGFRAAGPSTLNVMGFPVTISNTVTAQLDTCAAWSGRWVQTSSLCDFTWDAGATRL